jgi:hypothetical protein
MRAASASASHSPLKKTRQSRAANGAHGRRSKSVLARCNRAKCFASAKTAGCAIHDRLLENVHGNAADLSCGRIHTVLDDLINIGVQSG